MNNKEKKNENEKKEDRVNLKNILDLNSKRYKRRRNGILMVGGDSKNLFNFQKTPF